MLRTWIIIIGLALPFASGAAPIVITNAGFELPAIPAGAFQTVSAPPGWTEFGSINFGNRTIGVLHPATTALYSDPAPDGNNVGVIFLISQQNSPSGMFQQLGTNLQARTRYTLLTEVGNITNDPTPPNNFDFSGFPGYRIELLAGTNVVAMDDNSLLPPEGTFLTSTVTVTTAQSPPGIGEPLIIRLTNLDQAPGIEVNFDALQLNAETLPTPSIDIQLESNHLVRVTYTGTLYHAQSPTNLQPMDPQPPSPFSFSPTNARSYFRAGDQ